MKQQTATDDGQLAISKLNSLNDVSDLCILLKVLANPNRLSILLYLLDNEASVSEIESLLLIRQPSLSHELKKLRDADLVVTTRQAKSVLYRLKSDAVKSMLISVRRALHKSDASSHKHPQLENEPVSNTCGLECGLFATIQPETLI